MAIDKLSSDLSRILESDKAYKKVQQLLKRQYKNWNGRFYEITVNRSQVATKMQSAVEAMVEKGVGDLPKYKQQYPQIFARNTYADAIDTTIKNFNRPTGEKFGKAGKLLANSDRNNFGRLQNIFKIKGTSSFFTDRPDILKAGNSLRKAFYKNWQLNAANLMGIEYKDIGDTGTIGEDLPVAHDGNTTIFVDWLERRGNIANAELNLNVKEFDLAREIVNALGVDFQEDTDLKGKNFKQTRVVRARLGPSNKTENLDAKGGKTMLNALMDIKSGVLAGNFPYLSKKEAANVAASTPFKKQVAQAATHKLVDTIVKSGKKNKIKVRKKVKVKKPKNSKRKGSLRKAKPTRPKAKKLSLAQKVTAVKAEQRREKSEKGSSSAAASELVKIKKYINSRLGAEVRRNMGRPALMNRTGRFSNSVQLLSLTEGQNTIVAKYAYLLNPYATFENAGQRKWPLAYNPKPLIAKSIRNLAQGRIEQKLTVRRV